MTSFQPHSFLKKNNTLVVFFVCFLRFRVTAKLSGTWWDFPYTPCPTHASPIINIAHQNGTLVTTEKPIRTHHSHPKPMVYTGVHSWCCTFCVFGQMYIYVYVKCIWHFPIIMVVNRVFQCPEKASVLCLFIPPSALNSWEPLIFLLSP